MTLDERLVPTILPRLNGEHELICGNHDACHPHHRRNARSQGKYVEWGFKSVVTQTEVEGFLCCHLPYSGDRAKEDRYQTFRPKDTGRVLLHGHVHEAWKVRGRQVNVGVDVWDYAPVSLEEIIAFVRDNVH